MSSALVIFRNPYVSSVSLAASLPFCPRFVWERFLYFYYLLFWLPLSLFFTPFLLKSSAWKRNTTAIDFLPFFYFSSHFFLYFAARFSRSSRLTLIKCNLVRWPYRTSLEIWISFTSLSKQSHSTVKGTRRRMLSTAKVTAFPLHSSTHSKGILITRYASAGRRCFKDPHS